MVSSEQVVEFAFSVNSLCYCLNWCVCVCVFRVKSYRVRRLRVSFVLYSLTIWAPEDLQKLSFIMKSSSFPRTNNPIHIKGLTTPLTPLQIYYICDIVESQCILCLFCSGFKTHQKDKRKNTQTNSIESCIPDFCVQLRLFGCF